MGPIKYKSYLDMCLIPKKGYSMHQVSMCEYTHELNPLGVLFSVRLKS